MYGDLAIRTYWRKFDRKTGLVGAVLDSSKTDDVWRWPIAHYVLQTEYKFNPALSEDLGNGLMLVRLGGAVYAWNLVSGRQLSVFRRHSGIPERVGGDTFCSVGIRSGYQEVVCRVSKRRGERAELHLRPDFRPRLASASVQTIDNVNTRLAVQYCKSRPAAGKPDTPDPPMILVIGGHSYGYGDTPVLRQTYPEKAACGDANLNTRTISVTVPTATLLASPRVTLTAPLDDGGYPVNLSVSSPSSLTPFSQADHLVLLKQDKDSAEFLLYGNRRAHVSQVDPSVDLIAPAGDETHDDLRLVTLNAKQIGAYKFLVITRVHEAPEAIPIRAVTLPSGGGGNPPTLSGRVVINADSATFTW